MPTLAYVLILSSVLGQDTKAEQRLSDGFQLQDFQGAVHSLDDVRDRKLVVIAFLGVDCPVVSQYAPRLAELAGKFEPKGVAFFAIDANQQDGARAMGRFARENALTFPFLKDVGNELADRLQVQRTPEVVVLDAQRAIRYRGRIDDQFDRGVHRSAPSRSDLAVALEELLAGRDVSVPKTDAVGCRVGRVRRAGHGEVTYAKQVARILNDRCVACHRPGEIAPFGLTTYKPDRSPARPRRLDPRLASASRESGGCSSSNSFCASARPERGQSSRRFPGGVFARHAAARAARGHSQGPYGRLEAACPGPIYPARHTSDRSKQDRLRLRRSQNNQQARTNTFMTAINTVMIPRTGGRRATSTTAF